MQENVLNWEYCKHFLQYIKYVINLYHQRRVFVVYISHRMKHRWWHWIICTLRHYITSQKHRLACEHKLWASNRGAGPPEPQGSSSLLLFPVRKIIYFSPRGNSSRFRAASGFVFVPVATHLCIYICLLDVAFHESIYNKSNYYYSKYKKRETK